MSFQECDGFLAKSQHGQHLLVDRRALLLVFSHVLDLALFLVDRIALVLVDSLIDRGTLLFVDGTALLLLQKKGVDDFVDPS